MTESISLYNTLTKEEADKVYEQFIEDTKRHNTKCTLWLILVILSAVIIEACVNHYLSGGLSITLFIIIGVITLLMLSGIIDSFQSTAHIFWPPVYTYHKMLEKYQILRTSIQTKDCGLCDVVFDVFDDTNEVTHKFIYGLKKVVRVDVDTVTVDLANSCVCVPYEGKKG